MSTTQTQIESNNVTKFVNTKKANTVPARWINEKISFRRLPGNIDDLMKIVRPAFEEWMQADNAFKANTVALAKTVRKTFEVYSATEQQQGRVGFARLFDPSIPLDAKTRDLGGNATYNRLNYLIDKVEVDARPQSEGEDTDEGADDQEVRLTIKQRRDRIHEQWVLFKSAHSKGSVSMKDVEDLVRTMLGELWTEDNVERVLTTAA